MRLGSIELGGTKIVCAVGDECGSIFEQIKIPTTTPEETMKQVVDFFKDKLVSAIGIAAFGPIELNKKKATYGHILETTKLAWRHFDLLGSLKELNVPMELDTDVAGSLLGEHFAGAGKGYDNLLYITVGTGIGAGVMVNGQMVHGMLHPECGHVLVTRRAGDNAKSSCAYHDNCVEGLASGSAIRNHYGVGAEELLNNKEVWELEADYLAQAICDYICVVSPERIILGGGVLHVPGLIPLVRIKVKEYINNYLVTDELADIDNYIVGTGLGDDQGIIGGLRLAVKALGQ